MSDRTDQSGVPGHLVIGAGLEPRIITPAPDADPVIQFLYRDQPAELPVWWEGRLQVLPWGNNTQSSKLPRSGWCWQEQLDSGRWAWLRPEPAEIPACCACEKGVWYQVQEGMHGVIVRDERGEPHVYMLTQPASHYYEIMTRHNRMPVLIGQTI